MKKNLIAVILLFVLPIVSFAEPSMQETIDFIKSKTNITSTSKENKEDFRVEITDCGLKAYSHIKSTSGSSKGTWYDVIYTTHNMKPIPLNRLDPTRTEVFEVRGNMDSVVLKVKENKEIIMRNEKTNSDSDYSSYGYKKENNLWNNYSSPDAQYTMLIEVLDPRDVNIPKVIRAFNHLIKLCGGKGELF